MNKKMNQTEKKELATLLNKSVKLKLISPSKALYKHLFLATQEASKTQKKTLVSYIDKLEHIILNKTVTDKGKFKTLKVVVPRYVTVEVTVTDGQEAYLTKKPVEGGWRPDLGNFTKPYELNNGNPLRFNINNIVRRTDVPIATQIKDTMMNGGKLDGTRGNWYFEQENKGYIYDVVLIITPNTKISYRVISTHFEQTNMNSVSMFRSSPIKYSFIPTDFTVLTDNDECVIDSLHARYGSKMKKSRIVIKAELEAIRKELKAVELAQLTADKEAIKKLLENSGGEVVELEEDIGWNTYEVAGWCEKHGIGMYAFDQARSLFNHVKRKRHDYPLLVFFVVSNHMHLVTNQEYINSVYRRFANKLISSEVFTEEFKKENIYNGTIKTNLSYEDLKSAKDCVVIYDNKDLRDVFIQIFKEEREIYPTKNHSNHVIEIEYKDNVHIRLNPNVDIQIHDSTLDTAIKCEKAPCKKPKHTRCMNHNDVMDICQKLEIEFTNQSLSSLATQLKDKMLNCKAERRLFTIQERIDIKKSQGEKCAICLAKLTRNFQIDHIQPIASGGSNELDNLQALCYGCHDDKTRSEKEFGYSIRDKTKSCFNPKVEQIIFGDLNKHWAFVEVYGDIKAKNMKHLDLIKSRRNLMLFNKYDYPIYSVMDDVKPFSGEVQCGIYYIECTKAFPLRGNGWYYEPLVRYCLKKKIIKLDMIKYELLPSMKLEAHIFNELIYKILETFGDAAKAAVNSLIGTLGKTMHSITTSHFTQARDEAGHFSLYHKAECIPIEEDLYMMYSSAERKIAETSITLYQMVIDMEIVELHMLTEIVKENGGEVIALMTDCVSYVGEKFDLSPYRWGDNEKYQYEDKYITRETQRMAHYVRTETFNNEDFKYNEIADVTDNDFSPLVNQILKSDQGCMIDARAGTGKTYLVNEIKKELDKQGIPYESLAPTNKACRLLGEKAMTIHKFSNKIRKNNKPLNVIKYIFIDEVSMMKSYFYHFFIMIQKQHDIKFILSGDARQVKPVLDCYQGNHFSSYALYHLVDGNRINLTKCRRSDDKLFNLSLDCNKIDTTQFKTDKLIWNHLCFTNEARKRINAQMMKEHIKMKNVNDTVYPLKKDKDCQSQDVSLCRGMPVISRVNNGKYDVSSNETFTINKIIHGEVYLVNEYSEVNIDLSEFQKVFNVAFAITADKSQGSTFHDPYKIHEWNLMDKHRRYTAVTRGTKIENLFFA